MTHQTLVDLIRTVAEEANPKGGFMYGTRNDGGIHSVSTGAEGVTPKFPIIHLYSIRKTPDRLNNDQKWSVVMAFWMQDDLQNVPTETDLTREEKISEMETLCETFMNDLFDEAVQIDGEQQTPEVLQLAGTVSGWSCSFDILTKEDC